MPEYRYDHIHLRSPDPNGTARFFETMFGAEVTRDIYPPGTLYPGRRTSRGSVCGRPCAGARLLPSGMDASTDSNVDGLQDWWQQNGAASEANS